jgi:hypothetical protein
MSHIVTIKTEVRDAQALGAACHRLKLPEPVMDTVKLFSSEATGHCVQLPDWRYPVVCDLATGQVAYDNYQGRWGEPKHLGRLMQAYAVEKAWLEARRAGHTIMEQTFKDGSIKITIQAVGAA